MRVPHAATLSYNVHFSPFFLVGNGKKGFGGTGKYVGARGEVVIVEFAKGPVGTAFTVLT